MLPHCSKFSSVLKLSTKKVDYVDEQATSVIDVSQMRLQAHAWRITSCCVLLLRRRLTGSGRRKQRGVTRNRGAWSGSGESSAHFKGLIAPEIAMLPSRRAYARASSVHFALRLMRRVPAQHLHFCTSRASISLRERPFLRRFECTLCAATAAMASRVCA